MSDYQLTWITDHLAIGRAPMSFADLGVIRDQGVDGIINLCGEYCDLHEIESKSDFEVYYLPIPDESTPDMADMEKALDWLDEAIYLGKKILVHCRFGIGRTGTFVTAYLIRKGLGLKLAKKRLKHTPAGPESYRQWRLLKKYNRKSGMLKWREPSLENHQVVDLNIYFAEYEALTDQLETLINRDPGPQNRGKRCGSQTDSCCFRYFELGLMESVYLHNRINRLLKREARSEVIARAVSIAAEIRDIQKRMKTDGRLPDSAPAELRRHYASRGLRCPLSAQRQCRVYDHRPIGCRLSNVTVADDAVNTIHTALQTLSRTIFLAFTGSFMAETELTFPMVDTVSGRFVQRYFYYLAALAPPK